MLGREGSAKKQSFRAMDVVVAVQRSSQPRLSRYALNTAGSGAEEKQLKNLLP